MNKKSEKLSLENSAKDIFKAIDEDCGCDETKKDVTDFLENRKSTTQETISKFTYWKMLNNRILTCEKIMENFEFAGMGSQLFKCIDNDMQMMFEFSTLLVLGFVLYKPKSWVIKGIGAMGTLYIKTFWVTPCILENQFRRHAMVGRDLVSQELRNMYEFYDPTNP